MPGFDTFNWCWWTYVCKSCECNAVDWRY